MVWCDCSKVVGGGINSSLKPPRISKSFLSVLALLSLLIVSLFALSNTHSVAFADEKISYKVSLKSATITTNITGYTSGVGAKLDSDTYEVGDSVVLSWRGAAVGNDLVIPTSIKYSGSATTIGVQTIVPIDQIQTANTAYKKHMKQDYTMTTYDSLKSFATSTHLIEVGNCVGNGTVTIEFARVCPVYRMYNMITSEHLFTTNKTEYDNFQKKLDGKTEFWIGEGIDWLAPYSSSTVVHRLYNAGLGAMFRSSHYYTSDKTEINKLIKKYGWVDDGKAMQFNSGGSTPIYTCYNEALGSAHHYTSSKSEWSGLKKHGWDLEESKNVKNKAYTGVFSGIMGTSWTFSSNYYTVEHTLSGQSTPFARQVVAGKAKATTSAKALKYPGYAAGSIAQKTIAANNSTVVKITYSQKTFDITFNSNGGSEVAKQTVASGKTARRPENPTKGSSVFGGWYTDTALTKEFDFSTKITSNITLYARWGENIDAADIKLGDSLAYDGTEQTQVVTEVLMPDRKLVEGTDYKVLNNKATDAGDYTLTVQGIGTYAGTKTINFSVAKRELYISWTNTELTYNGQKQGPVGEAGMGLIESDKGKVIVGITDESKKTNASGTEYVGVPALSGDRAFNYYIHPGATSINYKINKADPTLESLTTIYAEANQTLSEIALPTLENGTLAWVDKNESIGEFEGTKNFKATFTPTDTTNYNTITVEVPIKIGVVKTNSSGIATIDNPKDGVGYIVKILGYSNSYSNSAIVQAVVYFNDSGVLTVKLPADGSMDARDVKISMVLKDSGLSVSDLPIVAYNSKGEALGSGKTVSVANNETGENIGDLKIHNGVKETSVLNGTCECTFSSTVIKTCSVCEYLLSKADIEPTGHPADEIQDYGDSGIAKECSKCGHVFFGTWEQDGNSNNGREAIEWVKFNDETRDGEQTLVSLFGLEKMKFDETGNIWNNSKIRSWLNSETDGFYNDAFSSLEKTKILRTYSDDVMTQDNVFLLSENQIARCTSKYPCYGSIKYNRNTGDWWTRTSVNNSSTAVYAGNEKGDISTDMYIYGRYCWNSDVYVRPAICLKVRQGETKVNISFQSAGVEASNLPKTQTIYAGDALDEVPEISRDGYRLLGWYVKDGESHKFINEQTRFDQDTVLIARWAPNNSYATIENVGVAYLNNPVTNVATKINVSYNWEFDSSCRAVKMATVCFDEEGEIFVTVFDSSRYDHKIGVFDQDDGTAISNIRCSIYNSNGSLIATGETKNEDTADEVISAGEFWAHNSFLRTVNDGVCECTGSVYDVEECYGCSTVLSKSLVKSPTGHPEDQLKNYGSSSIAEECKKCGHVIFGNWEQDGDESNGMEAIEWVKLGTEKSDGTQLLTSLHSLEERKFDASTSKWKDSEIRSWLNSEDEGFYGSAFTDSEKSKIKSASLSDVSTDDNVFLLSKDEVNNSEYFPIAASQVCYTTSKYGGTLRSMYLRNDDGWNWGYVNSVNYTRKYLSTSWYVSGSYINDEGVFARPALYFKVS